MNCLISAGPTREWIDPVRFISNPSSGKMGYALVQVAHNIGMDVTLVSGPVSIEPPSGVKTISVETALEMKDAMLEFSETADLIIMCAAVCDHRPQKKCDHKIAKENIPETLLLQKNPDILKILGSQKKPGQILVGFAAETHDILASAKKKLIKKNLDWIVVNDVSNHEIGFMSDTNEVIVLGASDEVERISLADKSIIAKKILHVVYPQWQIKAP